MADRKSVSIPKLQKHSYRASRASIYKDAKDFENRNNGGWQDSSEVTRCTLCDVKFTFTNRKHHCRQCGQVFCSKCSNYKVVINASLKRVRSLNWMYFCLQFLFTRYIILGMCQLLFWSNRERWGWYWRLKNFRICSERLVCFVPYEIFFSCLRCYLILWFDAFGM